MLRNVHEHGCHLPAPIPRAQAKASAYSREEAACSVTDGETRTLARGNGWNSADTTSPCCVRGENARVLLAFQRCLLRSRTCVRCGLAAQNGAPANAVRRAPLRQILAAMGAGTQLLLPPIEEGLKRTWHHLYNFK